MQGRLTSNQVITSASFTIFDVSWSIHIIRCHQVVFLQTINEFRLALAYFIIIPKDKWIKLKFQEFK